MTEEIFIISYYIKLVVAHVFPRCKPNRIPDKMPENKCQKMANRTKCLTACAGWSEKTARPICKVLFGSNRFEYGICQKNTKILYKLINYR